MNNALEASQLYFEDENYIIIQEDIKFLTQLTKNFQLRVKGKKNPLIK